MKVQEIMNNESPCSHHPLQQLPGCCFFFILIQLTSLPFYYFEAYSRHVTLNIYTFQYASLKAKDCF